MRARISEEKGGMARIDCVLRENNATLVVPEKLQRATHDQKTHKNMPHVCMRFVEAACNVMSEATFNLVKRAGAVEALRVSHERSVSVRRSGIKCAPTVIILHLSRLHEAPGAYTRREIPTPECLLGFHSPGLVYSAHILPMNFKIPSHSFREHAQTAPQQKQAGVINMSQQ